MNETAKATVIETYIAKRDDLRRFLAARLGSDDLAEDIIQEMFLRLQRTTFDRPVDNPAAYLYKVAFNLAHDFRRRKRRRVARDSRWVDENVTKAGTVAVAETAPPEDAYDAKRRLARIIAALGELPPRCRQVFVLHKLDGLSHREVAGRLGISRGMVEKHMTRALKHFFRDNPEAFFRDNDDR